MTRGEATRKRKIWVPGRGYLYLLIPPGIFLCLLFIWPLATVVYQGLFQPSFGFANYATILASTTHLRVLLFTFELAGEVTLICLLVAYPVAYMMSRAGDNMLHVALALVLIPFWTSVVIRTYAWAALFQRHGLVNDLLVQTGIIDEPVKFIYNNTGVLIGMVQILLPFMILPLLNAMRRMDMTLIRAAEILGANPIRVFFHVYLPLSMPGVTAGVLLVFISAVGFYVTPAVLGGPRQMMIAVLIEQYVTRTLNWPLASALATILLVATTVLYLVYERATRRIGSALSMGRG